MDLALCCRGAASRRAEMVGQSPAAVRSGACRTRPGGAATGAARRRPNPRSLRARASEAGGELLVREPEDARGAIAIGLGLYGEGKYEEALSVFERGLKLPGTGVKRFRDKPRLISEGEKQSVLYNIACCYSRMEDSRTGLVALAGCLESGYDDVAQLRADPDLAFLRRDDRFEGLLSRFQLGGPKGFLREFLGGFNL